MAHKILRGPRPNIVIMRLVGSIDEKDMTCDEELGLNAGHPLYVLFDCATVRVQMPKNFLDEARRSFLVNPNLAHVALSLETQTARMIAMSVAKVTCGKEMLSLHNSYGAALGYLVEFAKKHGDAVRTYP